MPAQDKGARLGSHEPGTGTVWPRAARIFGAIKMDTHQMIEALLDLDQNAHLEGCEGASESRTAKSKKCACREEIRPTLNPQEEGRHGS